MGREGWVGRGRLKGQNWGINSSSSGPVGVCQGGQEGQGQRKGPRASSPGGARLGQYGPRHAGFVGAVGVATAAAGQPAQTHQRDAVPLHIAVQPAVQGGVGLDGGSQQRLGRPAQRSGATGRESWKVLAVLQVCWLLHS